MSYSDFGFIITSISAIAAAASAFAATFALRHNNERLKQDNLSKQLEAFQRVYDDIKDTEKQQYIEFRNAKGPEIAQWESLMLNSLEHYCFLVNRKFITDPGLATYFQDAVKLWYNSLVLGISFDWAELPGKDEELVKGFLINILDQKWVKDADITRDDSTHSIRIKSKEGGEEVLFKYDSKDSVILTISNPPDDSHVLNLRAIRENGHVRVYLADRKDSVLNDDKQYPELKAYYSGVMKSAHTPQSADKKTAMNEKKNQAYVSMITIGFAAFVALGAALLSVGVGFIPVVLEALDEARPPTGMNMTALGNQTSVDFPASATVVSDLSVYFTRAGLALVVLGTAIPILIIYLSQYREKNGKSK